MLVEEKYLRYFAKNLHDKSTMERVTGIEPVSQPWEGRILPLYYTRKVHKNMSDFLCKSQLIFYHSISGNSPNLSHFVALQLNPTIETANLLAGEGNSFEIIKGLH